MRAFKKKSQIDLGLLVIIGLVLLIVFSLGSFGGASKTISEKNKKTISKTDFDNLNEGENYQTTLTIDEETGDVEIKIEKTKLINYTDNLITNNTLSVNIVEDGQLKILNWDLNNNKLIVINDISNETEIYNLSFNSAGNKNVYYDSNCNYILSFPKYNKKNWFIVYDKSDQGCDITKSTSSNSYKEINFAFVTPYSKGKVIIADEVKFMRLFFNSFSYIEQIQFASTVTYSYGAFIKSNDGYDLIFDKPVASSSGSTVVMPITYYFQEGVTKINSFGVAETDIGYLEVENVSLDLVENDSIYLKGNLRGIADLGADKDYINAYCDLQFKNETELQLFLNNLECDKVFFRDDQPTKYEFECYVNNDIQFSEGNIYLKVKEYENSKQNLLGIFTELIADFSGVDYDVWEQATIYGDQRIRILIDKEKVSFDLKNGAFKGSINFNGDNYRGLKIVSGKVEDKNILIKKIPELNTYYLSVSE